MAIEGVGKRDEIPASAIQTFDQLYGVEIAKLDAELEGAISQKTAELAKGGALNSGDAPIALFDFVKPSVAIRRNWL